MCTTLLFCGVCTVVPLINRQSMLTVVHHLPSGQEVSSAYQNSNQSTAASMSFEGCTPGTMLGSLNGTDRCLECLPGSSRNVLDAVCKPCIPGFYSTDRGASECMACLPGSYSEGPAAEQCLACDVNSWQPLPAQSDCRRCDSDQYRSVPQGGAANATSSTNGSTIGECLSCPVGVDCHSNGTIEAQEGFFVVIQDHTTGRIDAVECRETACVGGGVSSANLQPNPATGLLLAQLVWVTP